MLRRILTITFWAALAFAFIMAVLPLPPELPGQPSDKLQHIAAFATLAVLGSSAFVDTSLRRLALWLVAFGALIETTQAIPFLHRSSDLRDWLVDAIAVAVTLLLVNIARNQKG